MAHRLSHIIPIFGPYMAHTTQFGKGTVNGFRFTIPSILNWANFNTSATSNIQTLEVHFHPFIYFGFFGTVFCLPWLNRVQLTVTLK